MSHQDCYDYKSRLITALCKDCGHCIQRNMERREKGVFTDDNERTAIFDLLLESNGEKGSQHLDSEQLIDEAFLFLGAGIDTTNITLSYATFYILHTPGVMARLREELLQVPVPEDGRFEWKYVQNMSYLVSA